VGGRYQVEIQVSENHQISAHHFTLERSDTGGRHPDTRSKA
jgi:hypothetical protein